MPTNVQHITMSPTQLQAITWANGDLLSIGHLQTKFGEIAIKYQVFFLKKMHWKMSTQW